MIIICPSCNKKFEIDPSLIPNEGRNLQCGSCAHVWFYNDKDKTIQEENKIEEVVTQRGSNKESTPKNKKPVQSQNINQKALVKYQKKTSFTFGKFLSYLIVSIISFIALIIFLDTFKYPLSNFFPNLELFLYNLFEILKDIVSFVKDLI